MGENRRIEGAMEVFVEGTAVHIVVDTKHPLGKLTASGKSKVVARTLGLVNVEVNGRKFGVAGGLYESIGKEDIYANEVAKMTADLVANGMTPAKAKEFALAHIAPPKAAKTDAATAIKAAKDLSKGAVRARVKGDKGKGTVASAPASAPQAPPPTSQTAPEAPPAPTAAPAPTAQPPAA